MTQEKQQNLPIPDPTILTREALKEAVYNLETRLSTRVDAIDEATRVFHEDLVRVPTTVDKAVTGLRELIEAKIEALNKIFGERFIRIDGQFTERDKRTEQLTQASATAVTAALQAAKEAVGEQNKSSALAIAKSEASTIESINKMQELFQTSIAGINTQIADIKSRLDKGDGHNKGLGDGWGYLVGVLGIIGMLISFWLRH
jgi:DNA anti-recombination protein RmuC